MSSATEESLTTSSKLAYGTDTEADDGDANDNDSEVEETHKQVVFALSLLGANLVNAVSLNLEAGYVGHIRADEDSGSAQMAAYSVGEAFCGWFTEFEHLWAGLAAQIGSAFGAGDEQHVMELMRMGITTAAVCGIVAWSIVFPFGKFLLEAAFVMHQDVHDYAVPFTYVHMLGNFTMYLHNAMEGMIQGMQHIKAFSTIYALRGVYMGVVNYFAILYFEGGIVGEAIASATRNTFTFCMCLYFLRTHPDAKRFDPRLVHPTKEQWRDFLENGCWLLAMGVAGHLSKFLQPMMTSRLQEEEAERALGAKLIVGRIGTYPHIVTKVLLTVVVVLGSKYLGSGKADLYKRFITQLLSATAGVSALVATLFFMSSTWIYSIYTDHEAILAECNRVTLAVTCQFFIGICSAVVTGMCFASQQFKQLSLINIVVEATVFVPGVLLVSNGYAGEVTYGTLIWIDVVVETCRLFALFYISKETILNPSGDDDLKLLTVDKTTNAVNDADEVVVAVEGASGDTNTGGADPP